MPLLNLWSVAKSCVFYPVDALQARQEASSLGVILHQCWGNSLLSIQLLPHDVQGFLPKVVKEINNSVWALRFVSPALLGGSPASPCIDLHHAYGFHGTLSGTPKICHSASLSSLVCVLETLSQTLAQSIIEPSLLPPFQGPVAWVV